MDKQRDEDMIALWLARPVAQRSGSHVIRFHRWIGRHHPNLLARARSERLVPRLLFGVLGKHVR